MENYRSRVLSLHNWPKRRFFPKYEEIAEAGFYYNANPVELESDGLQCAFCPLYMVGWGAGDNPFLEHAKHLSDCIHLQAVKGRAWIRRHTIVKSPQAPQTTDGTNAYNLQPLLCVGRAEYRSQTLSISQIVGAPYVTPKGTPYTVPLRPQYVPYEMRLTSLIQFKRQLALDFVYSVNAFAGAGFYWPGFGRKLACYYCACDVEHAVNEDPFVTHSMLNRHCFHLISEKGETYIDHVRSPMMDRTAVQEENVNIRENGPLYMYHCVKCGQGRTQSQFSCCLGCKARVCYSEECLTPSCCRRN